MENKQKSLIKVGNEISFTTGGVDYNLINGMFYNVTYDPYDKGLCLHEASSAALPSNMYVTEDDNAFTDKVLSYFRDSEDGTTGVLFSGLKGSGKTVMAKYIATKSDLPVVIIDKSISPHVLKELFNNLSNRDVVYIFDEIDKLGERYDDNFLLQILDGANSASGRRLVLFTANKSDEISEYMIDRCSRIRYHKKYDSLSPSTIMVTLDSILKDKSKVKPLTDFIIETFSVISFDNVVAFAKDVNRYPEDTFENLLKDMNITVKN